MFDNDGRARMPLFLLTAVVATLVVPARGPGWSWPVDGPVLAPFDFDRSHPYDAGQHRGTDIGAPSGSAVAAPVSGSVSFAGSVPSSGKVVTIETTDGYSVTLLHLGSYSVRRGQPVEERSVVGTVGLSGEPEQTSLTFTSASVWSRIRRDPSIRSAFCRGRYLCRLRRLSLPLTRFRRPILRRTPYLGPPRLRLLQPRTSSLPSLPRGRRSPAIPRRTGGRTRSRAHRSMRVRRPCFPRGAHPMGSALAGQRLARHF